MSVCWIIFLIICVADLIAEIFEYFYEKYHDWDNDVGYQQWLSVHKNMDDDNIR